MKIFSALVIVVAACVSAALFALNVHNSAYYTDSPSALFYHFVVPGGLAVGFLAALALSVERRLMLALCLAAVVPALYATEIFLRARAQSPAAGSETAFDRRSKLRVILDFRARGIDAYPVMRAKSMLVKGPDGSTVPALGPDGPLPLASLPNKRVVSCNESGQWLAYDSDDYGFHNPPGAWQTKPVNVALVGDSFTEGSCVPSDRNIAAHLRTRFGSVLNLGVSGFGPLTELGAIREYLVHVRPRVVVWLYFEGNDLFEDLAEERRSRILLSYLDGGFSQGLMAKRDGIAARFKAYLDSKMVEAMDRVDNPIEPVQDFLQLYHLRETFGLDPVGLGVTAPVTEADYRLFRTILDKARRAVEAWGGRFVFAYLPDSPRYFAAARDSRIRDGVRRRVLDIVTDLGLASIDVHAAFSAESDPRSLFAFPGSHYNEKGYALAAKAIAGGIGAIGHAPLMTKVRH